MNDTHPHPDDTGPGGSKFRRARFDESDVVAFVEGELDASRLTEFHAALERHPEVREMVESMRAQRAVLASFEDEPAPGDLLTRVHAALQSEAEPIAIARHPAVVRVRPNPLRVFVQSRAGRSVLAAAAVLALAGAGVMLIARVIERSPIGETRTDFDVPLAMNDEPEAPAAVAPVPTADPAADTAIAVGEPSIGDPDTAEPVLVVAEPMSAELAGELAQEGRLAIRVSADHELAAEAIARIADRSDGSGTWRLRADVPGPVVAALAPERNPAEQPSGPLLADDDETDRPFLIERPLGDEPPAVFMLESAATPEALAGALEALGVRARASAEFVELDEPVELPSAFDADAVLWWQRPIAEWGARVALPVIVEQSRR